MEAMMVLKTQMKYLFSYKMFIRYLYINVYTWGREEGSFSDEQPELCWWEPRMSESHWVWSYQVSNPASLPSLCHASGKGPKKDGKETPKARLPLSSLVLLAPVVPAATKSSCCHCPSAPELICVTLKENYKSLPKCFLWGFNMQLSRGDWCCCCF